jgi:N-acetylglucosaminyl-diphospho-decaprenol L-rhamnosyltransferase
MNRTGAVIVTYNSAGVIERCLASCADLPTVVVDNGSRDNTSELVRKQPHVKLIANADNRGFAAAVNQGVAELDTELVLLLNPDVELETSIEPLADAFGGGVGLTSGKLLDSEGKVQIGFTLRRFPTSLTLAFEVLGINRLVPQNGVNRHYRCLDMDLDKPSEAEQPPGAFLMFPREVWHRLGGFDTQFYPLWFEDVDFCLRVHAAGLKILYVPEVTARHQGGHSIAGLNWSYRELCWYVSLLKYAHKHYRPYAYRGVSAAVVLGSVLRAVAGVIRLRSLRPIKVYTQVARLAGQCLISGRIGGLKCLSGYSERTS